MKKKIGKVYLNKIDKNMQAAEYVDTFFSKTYNLHISIKCVSRKEFLKWLVIDR